MDLLASLFDEMVSVEDVNETPMRVASEGFASAAAESYSYRVALASAMPGACAMLDRPTVAGE